MASHLLEIGAGQTSVGSLAPLPLPLSERVTGKPTMGFLELSKCIYKRKNERRLRPAYDQNTFALIKIIFKRCDVWCLLICIAFLIPSVKAPELCPKLDNPVNFLFVCPLLYVIHLILRASATYCSLLKSR
jgi:hypothetical protein